MLPDSGPTPVAGLPRTLGSAAYYADKVDVLSRVFGVPVTVEADHIVAGERRLPVLRDVIVAQSPLTCPPVVRQALWPEDSRPGPAEAFAADIQRTFGAEWTRFSEVLPEYDAEFAQYFDLVHLPDLTGRLVADLGCGAGRYADRLLARPELRDQPPSLVLVDFSDAIFVARQNLAHTEAVFVLADLLDLPFAPGAFDFAYSLGVLHHLPMPALDVARSLRPLSPRFLLYLYYALDNRPGYYRRVLSAVTRLRRLLATVESERKREVITRLITALIYWPLSRLGTALAHFNADNRVPLADFYRGKSWRRLQQDAYDRFFTSIEQRVTRAECEALADGAWEVQVSEELPYWHFLLQRRDK